MASHYFYRRDGVDTGPASFRELVALVRDEALRADDLVRSQWDSDWQPAAELVGLFHLAGRDDVLARWQAEQRRHAATRQSETDTSFSGDEIDDLLNQAASLPHDQQSAESDKFSRQAAADSTQHTDDRPFADSHLAHAIQAATHEPTPAATRHKRRQRWPLCTLSQAFRWGFSLAFANIVALQVIGWTRTELLRFPDAVRTFQGPCIFPGWGPCSYAEYAFLLTDAMLLAAALGYGLACGLEALTQD